MSLFAGFEDGEMDLPPTVYGSVRRMVDSLPNADPAVRAKAALALRLAAQMDAPEEGRGIAAVARELRMLLQELAASNKTEQTSRLDQMLGSMAKPGSN